LITLANQCKLFEGTIINNDQLQTQVQYLENDILNLRAIIDKLQQELKHKDHQLKDSALLEEEYYKKAEEA